MNLKNLLTDVSESTKRSSLIVSAVATILTGCGSNNDLTQGYGTLEGAIPVAIGEYNGQKFYYTETSGKFEVRVAEPLETKVTISTGAGSKLWDYLNVGDNAFRNEEPIPRVIQVCKGTQEGGLEEYTKFMTTEDIDGRLSKPIATISFRNLPDIEQSPNRILLKEQREFCNGLREGVTTYHLTNLN